MNVVKALVALIALNALKQFEHCIADVRIFTLKTATKSNEFRTSRLLSLYFAASLLSHLLTCVAFTWLNTMMPRHNHTSPGISSVGERSSVHYRPNGPQRFVREKLLAGIYNLALRASCKYGVNETAQSERPPLNEAN